MSALPKSACVETVETVETAETAGPRVLRDEEPKRFRSILRQAPAVRASAPSPRGFSAFADGKVCIAKDNLEVFFNSCSPTLHG